MEGHVMADEPNQQKLVELQEKVLGELVLIRWFLLVIVVVFGLVFGYLLLAVLAG
jgi:hypothetical protein